jgi:hypothetical protein
MPAGMETALSLLPSQGDSSLTCAEYKSKAKFSYFGAYAMTTLFLFCLSAIMESRKCKKDGFHVGAEVWRVNDGAGDRDGAIGKRGDSGEVLHIARKHHTHTDGRADTNTKIYVLWDNGTCRWYNPPDLSRKKIHSLDVSCGAGDAATLNV